MRSEEIIPLLDRNKAEVEERIENGIEMNRKGHFGFQVTDEKGNALPGVRLEVEQTEHEFVFGANIFMLDSLETDEKNEKYKKAFAELFNTATIPFYWNTLEPEKGKPRFSADSPFSYRRPPIDPCVDFCLEHGITPKAHCLNYDLYSPAWLLGKDVAEIKRCLAERMEVLAAAYKDKIPCWEVINELLCRNGKTAFYDDPEVAEWSYRMAERYFPANELMFNEATGYVFGRKNDLGNRNPYYMLIERTLSHGARIDSVGMQFHMFHKKEDELKAATAYYDLLSMLRILDQFAGFQKPLQITEVTIPSYDGTEDDCELQAEILRRLYRLWFSHPAMSGVIYWNLADGYAFNATPGDMAKGENYYRGGLLDFNIDQKPAYKAVYDLIHNEWHTSLTAETGSAGTAEWKGFYGKYRVRALWNGGEKTVELDFKKTGTRTQKIVLPL